MSTRPAPTEYAPYFARYVDLVPEDDICITLKEQGSATESILRLLNDKQASYRYAPDKWSVKQLVGHVTDSERIFGYRALSIARGETRKLPGYDEKSYGVTGEFDRRPWNDLIAELATARQATVALFRGLPEEAWDRSGVANDNAISVRGLAYVIVGHERHHLNVLRERYLQAAT
ncbi:MAG: DinB family protein [Acidobacteria bacterium]|nr:MAG: DinB family protein [Acidobacteriota bacterium]